MFINGSISWPGHFTVATVSYWCGTTMSSPAKLPMATQGVLAASPELDVDASPNLEEKEKDDCQMTDAAPDMELLPRGLGVVAWHVARQVFVIEM